MLDKSSFYRFSHGVLNPLVPRIDCVPICMPYLFCVGKVNPGRSLCHTYGSHPYELFTKHMMRHATTLRRTRAIVKCPISTHNTRRTLELPCSKGTYCSEFSCCFLLPPGELTSSSRLPPAFRLSTGRAKTNPDHTTTKFPASALVYHEVLAGWTKAMHFISGSNRFMERLNVFGSRGGRKDKAASEERLLAEIEELERKVRGVPGDVSVFVFGGDLFNGCICFAFRQCLSRTIPSVFVDVGMRCMPRFCRRKTRVFKVVEDRKIPGLLMFLCGSSGDDLANVPHP